MASLIWRLQRARRPDRGRLARRIDDGQRQQAEVDADGGEQRDQIAPRDRLAGIGAADRLLAAARTRRPTRLDA